MSNKDSIDGGIKPAHLFVLVHGLTGSPKHMKSIEAVLKDTVEEFSQEKMCILIPPSFSVWKTYDGLKLNANRVLNDVLGEIEAIKEEGYIVTKISIIGYSMGGLISRYLIGELERLGAFTFIEPVFFSTFATPHVGVHFYGGGFFSAFSNFLGPHLFGYSGKEMFLKDKEKLLLQMTDPDTVFLEGLAKFKKRVLVANAYNDRTVPFYTSFITEYNPLKNLDEVSIKYLKHMAFARVNGKELRPHILDFVRSDIGPKDKTGSPSNIQEFSSKTRTNALLKGLISSVMLFLILPIWLPIATIVTFSATMVSKWRAGNTEFSDVAAHWERVSKSVYGKYPIDKADVKEALRTREKTQHENHSTVRDMTNDVVEGVMYVQQKMSDDVKVREDSSDEDKDDATHVEPTYHLSNKSGRPLLKRSKSGRAAFQDGLIRIDIEANDRSMAENSEFLSQNQIEKFPLFREESRLNVDRDRQMIIDSLNTLEWIKIPVYMDVWNAHAGIVSRTGISKNRKGTPIIYIWSSILRNHLKGETD